MDTLKELFWKAVGVLLLVIVIGGALFIFDRNFRDRLGVSANPDTLVKFANCIEIELPSVFVLEAGRRQIGDGYSIYLSLYKKWGTGQKLTELFMGIGTCFVAEVPYGSSIQIDLIRFDQIVFVEQHNKPHILGTVAARYYLLAKHMGVLSGLETTDETVIYITTIVQSGEMVSEPQSQDFYNNIKWPYHIDRAIQDFQKSLNP